MRDTECLKGSIISHRGFHNKEKGIPENSLLAFNESIKNGYIIELDVHLLKDGSIVVFHDDNLFRMTNVDRNLKDCTYEDIKELKLYDTDCNIPLLKHVLDLVNNQVLIIIEVKTDNKAGVLEKRLMEELNTYEGKFVIKSFNPFSVYWFKKHFPQIIRGQLSCDFRHESFNILKKILLKNMFFNFLTTPDFISYGINSLPHKRVEKFRKKGLVLGWTIKSKEEYEYAKKYCDNFICENIEKILPDIC